MNLARLGVLAAASLLAAATVSAENLFSLLFHHDFEVIANGDVSYEGKNLPRPTADHPLYYLAVSSGYHDFGGIVAGDKEPKPHDMMKVVGNILAKQGYRMATNKNLPSIVIVYSWGTLYPERFPGTTSMSNILNRYQISDFVGYRKKSGEPGWLERGFPELSQGLSFIGNDVNFDAMTDTPYYVIALAAYDYQSAVERKDVRLLWRTRISTPSMGFDMDESLPKMMAIAAPYIGRNTSEPVRIRASDHYRPDVEYGAPSVVPDDTPDQSK